MNRFLCLLALVPLVVLSATGGAAQTSPQMYVTSEGATLKAEPRASAGTVADVALGTGVTVIEQKGPWYHVEGAGARGWIYRGKLGDAPPAAETAADMGDPFAGLGGGSSIDVASADTSRSMRGLSPETAAYADNRRTPEQARKALDQVLAPKVTEAELRAFLAAGKIGEFAQ